MTVTVPPLVTPAVPSTPLVRPAAEHELPAVARVIAEAFYDDPTGHWFYPRADQRMEQLERAFRILSVLPAVAAQGVVLTTPDVAGAAVWVPPHPPKPGRLDELRLLVGAIRASGRDTLRGLRGAARMDAAHPDEPHWYLDLMGVAPGRQGRGIGAALLQPMLHRLDAEGSPAYLEATTPRNRALYERHGFAVIGEYRLPGDGARLYRMWRAPAAA